MSTSQSAPFAPESFGLRLLRGCVALALALALTVIAGILVLGCVPGVRAAFAPLFTDESKLPKGILALAVLFLILLPALLLFWPILRRALGFKGATPVAGVAGNRRGRFRWLGWPGLLVGWILVVPVLVWLSWDDPAIRQPVSIEEFAPAFPGADQSYAVLMQYSKQKPSAEAQAFAEAKLAVPGFQAGPQDGAKWIEFVTANRAGLEADWTLLAPQRRWLGELAAFDRIGDLTPAVMEADVVKFQPWRALSFHLCAMATLQSLDGHGDDAMATLLPLLDVSRKLQLSSRTLIRSVIAEVSERIALQTALLVLDHGPVSAATRGHLTAALGNENGAALARRLIMVDYVQFAPVYLSTKLGDAIAPTTGAWSLLRRPLNFLSRLFINPNATRNLYGDHIRELAALAEARDLRQFSTRNWSFGDEALLKPGLKNLGGRIMVNSAVPAFDKVIETHWKVADLRVELRKRLAT